MHGPRLLEPGRRRGTKSYLLAFLDDASRLVPFAAFYPAESSACFHDALKQALLRRGVPQRLYASYAVDNIRCGNPARPDLWEPRVGNCLG